MLGRTRYEKVKGPSGKRERVGWIEKRRRRSCFLQNTGQRVRGRGPSVESLTKLFVSCLFIRNSNYRAFQLDQVKQSSLSSYINQRVWDDRSLTGQRKTGPASREPQIGIAMNKLGKGIIRADVLSPWYREKLNTDRPATTHPFDILRILYNEVRKK